MSVGQQTSARGSSEQLVQGHPGSLRLNIPQGYVYRRDRGHGDGATTPIGAAVEKLPGVLNFVGVDADQQRHDMLGEVSDNSEFAAVQSRIAEASNPVIGGELQRDKVAVGAGDDNVS